MLVSLIVFFILSSTGFLYFKYNPQFGGKITAELKKRYALSPNWKNNQFENLEETGMDISLTTIPSLIKNQLQDRHLRAPKKPIPVENFDSSQFNHDSETPKFIWFGHSALLLQLDGKNFLIDPMLGPDASPVGPIRTRRFSEGTLDLIDKLPRIDALLMTHDHYDHIDYESIIRLKDKVKTYYVALGIARHFESWGIPAEQIVELDWWDQVDFSGVEITFTPSRHFSGRGLTDRAKGLWGGWFFKGKEHKIYWSGDGGYGRHFSEVKNRLGTCDWFFIECGQYNERWHQIHNYPEEAVQACLDVNAGLSIPVHWGGFALAMHPWKEPIERYSKEAHEKKVKFCTPKIGQLVEFNQEPVGQRWYEMLG